MLLECFQWIYDALGCSYDALSGSTVLYDAPSIFKMALRCSYNVLHGSTMLLGCFKWLYDALRMF